MLQAKQAYILLRDQKPYFRIKSSSRLINPTRLEVGRISKTVLESVNKFMKPTIVLSQWINTADLIKWFNGIKNKVKCTFVQIDIIDYYLSISKDLFTLDLNFAQEYSNL